MANIDIYKGNFPQARELGLNLIQFGKDGADLLVLCLGHDIQGFIAQLIGNLDEAISHQQKAIEFAEAVPDHLTRIGAGAKLGQSLLRAKVNYSPPWKLLKQAIDSALNKKSLTILPHFVMP